MLDPLERVRNPRDVAPASAPIPGRAAVTSPIGPLQPIASPAVRSPAVRNPAVRNPRLANLETPNRVDPDRVVRTETAPTGTAPTGTARAALVKASGRIRDEIVRAIRDEKARAIVARPDLPKDATIDLEIVEIPIEVVHAQTEANRGDNKMAADATRDHLDRRVGRLSVTTVIVDDRRPRIMKDSIRATMIPFNEDLRWYA